MSDNLDFRIGFASIAMTLILALLIAGVLFTDTASASTLDNSPRIADMLDARGRAALKTELAICKSPAGGKIRLKATAAEQADGYQFLIARDARFKQDLKEKTGERQAVAFSQLPTGRQYYCKVRAYRTADGKLIYGPWSQTRSTTTRKVLVAVVGSTSKDAGAWLKHNGCKVVDIRNAKTGIDSFEGLIIPGGGDIDPSLYGQEPDENLYDVDRDLDLRQISAVNEFAEAGKPIIGICRGSQVTNVAFGGTLLQHIPGWHKGKRTVRIAEGSWLYGLFGEAESTIQSHHQCVQELGDGLVATQWDKKDGRIEAFEHESLPIFGLQWHPEGMGGQGRAVARKFIQECMKYN